MTNQGSKHPTPAPACLGKAACKDCDIRQLALFAGLPESELDALLQPVEVMHFEPQARIYKEGVAGAYAFTVRKGVVKLVKNLPNGDVRIVRLPSRSDTIGLETLLKEPYHHTAIAITPAELCRIPIAVLNSLDQRSPYFHRQLITRWQKSVDAAESFIIDLSTGHAKARLAHLLLNFFSDYMAEIWNSPARDDLAHMLGLTIETTSRLMAEFKREGLIDEADGKITIVDAVALRTIAEG